MSYNLRSMQPNQNSRTVGTATTTFTWDIASGLPVVLDDGNQYLYGAGLSAMKQSGNWFYYLADGLGSTMAVVDSDGDVMNGYTYDVYGEPTVTGSLANEFDFAGQQTDATGLQYLMARYYDPVSGVFLSRDPLAAGQHWTGSLGSYAHANPIVRTDPSGLRWTIEGAGGGGGFHGDGSTNLGGPSDEAFMQCVIWGVQGGVAGGVGGAGAGALVGAIAGCAAGMVSTVAPDNWLSQCAIWGIAASAGAWGSARAAAVGCLAGAAANLADDDPFSQCVAWAFLGLADPRMTNAISGCLAGAVASPSPPGPAPSGDGPVSEKGSPPGG